MILQICALYSQSILGPRWFLPGRFRFFGFDFYKTKEEVLQLKPDAEKVNKFNLRLIVSFA
jgi:hypothetical protein